MDMWRPFTNSIAQWARNCRMVYDKFHVLQHANKAIDEVRRAEFFRKGGRMRAVVDLPLGRSDASLLAELDR